MKKILTIIAILIYTSSFGQWTYKEVNSEFDGKFKKAYTQTNNGGYLSMETNEVKVIDTTYQDDIGYIYISCLKDSSKINFEGINYTYNCSIFKNADIGSEVIGHINNRQIYIIERVENLKTRMSYFKVKFNRIIETYHIEKIPFLVLSGLYFCDDYTSIDFVLVNNGISKKYELSAIKSRDSRLYYFNEFIWTDGFIKNFKSASKCLIRVNQDFCTDDYYQFNFSGSGQAFNFIIK